MVRRPSDFNRELFVLSHDVPGSDAYSEAVAATGSITFTTFANYVDGETFTLSDGLNTVVFEMDPAGDGAAAGNVAVDISGDTTAAEVAATAKTVIEGALPGITVVDAGAGVLTLTNDVPGAHGNVPITDTVMNGAHTSSGMSGGLNATGNTIADTTIKLFKARRAAKIVSAMYINPTGLAQDASNYFNIKLLNGATVMANWSTETGEEGTIAANTFVDMVLATDHADRMLAADDVLSVMLDETGTAVLPPGRLVVELEYV